MRSLWDDLTALHAPDHGLRIAALSIRPEQNQHCTLCEGPFRSAADGWAPVQALYAGPEQLGMVCADCIITLRKMEHAR